MQEDPLGLGILPVEKDGFIHLGAPVGSQVFTYAAVKRQVDKVETLLEKLPDLENPHAEFVLLWSCFSLPKVSYLQRVCPPLPSCLQLWRNFDDSIRNALNRILGVGMGDTSWLQAQLPVSRGGLGIRSSINFSSAAYLSSFSSSKGQITDLVPNLQIVELEEAMEEETFECLSQGELSLRIEEKLHQDLLNMTTITREKARLQSLQLPHAGDWLFVVPSPVLGLQLRGPEFRTAVLYRLGEPLFLDRLSFLLF